MKKFLYLLVLTVFAYNASAQHHNIWYFGDSAGIDFNSGTAVSINNGNLVGFDNNSSICDTNGNLLFYSNGETIWNKNHAIMQNGSGIMGSSNSTHGSIIVKKPNSNIYYLFTTPDFGGANGFRFTQINMSLQGGLGEVTSKNNLLLGPVAEKCVAVRHQNGIDMWIITHLWNSDKFYAYKIDSTGLNTNPVISTIGSIHTGGKLGTYNSMGQMSSNIEGNKIALAIYDLGNFEIFDFNNNTGTLSNDVTLSGFNKAWGIEFSYNGKYLYTTEWANNKIYQFDITSGIDSVILNSKQQVGIGTSPHNLYKVGFMTLGPNKKIYVAKFEDHYVGRIDFPDSAGIACNYVDSAIYLGTAKSYAGLVSIDKSILIDTISCLLNMNISQSGNSLLTTSIAQNYNWYNCSFDATIPNSNSSSFIPSSSGSYAVIGESNNCKDTSVCLDYLVSSVSEQSLESQIMIYPNPTINGELIIYFSDILSPKDIPNFKIFNNSGQLIKYGILNQNSSALDVSSFSNGKYVVQIMTRGEIIHKSFIKSF